MCRSMIQVLYADTVPRILGDISEQEMHAYSTTRVPGKLVRVFGDDCISMGLLTFGQMGDQEWREGEGKRRLSSRQMNTGTRL